MAPLIAAGYGYYGPHHSLIAPWVAGVLIVVLLLTGAWLNLSHRERGD